MSLHRISRRDRKKPEAYVAEPASIAEGRGRGKGKGRDRAQGRGRGRGRPKAEEESASPIEDLPVAAEIPVVQNKRELIGRRLTVHWDKEEEDFEGYVRDYEPGGDFPYEVAYDDGDEEWGHFSATHFHTDEVNRKYTWLTKQDVAVSAAAAAVWAQQKLTDAKSSAFEPASAQTQAPPATASNARPSVSLATQKGLLRANQSKAQAEKADNAKQSVGTQPLPSSNGQAISPTQEQQAAANDKDSKPDLEAHVVQHKFVAAKAKAASPPADEEAAIAPNKRQRISPATDSTTPTKLRDSTPRIPAESKSAAAATAAAAHPSPASAKQVQRQGVLKEPKLRRLRKASDVSAAAHTAELPVQAPDLQHVQNGVAKQGRNGSNSASPIRIPAAMLDASVSVPPATGKVGGSAAAAQDTGVPPLLAPPHAQAAEGASAPASYVNQSFEAVPIDLEGSAQPDVKDSNPEQAEPDRKGLQLAQASSSGSAVPKRSPSLLFAMAHAKSATEYLQQAAAQPPSSSPKPANPLSHPSSAARPTLPFQAPKLPLPMPASSTRIAMPRSLTSLASLKTADSLPRAEPVSSPATAPEPAAISSSAAELAASEGQLQATAQQFQDLLQNTLQRTKEGVHRVREFVLKVAGGQNGKVAARRLIIMVLDYIETAQMHKRIDLFYLMDSLLQASQRDSKPGSEARTEAMKIITKVIAAGLHRIARAMGQDSECISKASKVFEIWQRRQILKASVVTPALQLMAKLRAEHDSAQAATEPVFRMGQAMEGRRPMRVNLPCVPPHSQTGLPEHVMHLMLDQWASLAGFRFQGSDGQQVEFRLKPQWVLPQQADSEDWDINPASAMLPQEEVLAHAAILREQHLDELEWQREAKEKRERSPWGQEHAMPDQASTFASPVDSVQQEDVDMDEAQSPDRGHTGYISTDPNASFHFEPPRAPVHQGVSGDSPPDGHYGSYQSAYGYPQWSSSSLGGMGHMGSMGHMPLQHSQSMYDPFGSQLSLQQPRMQQLVMEHMQSGSNSQSPDTAEHWYNVPFDEGQKQAPAQDQQRAAEQTLARGLVGQAVQGSVAVRDSNTDFDADTAWSDDDVPPPLPAEPAPPLPESQPPLPSEPSPGALPPLPPDEDQPPLPPDEASEARLATAGLFEPASLAAPHPAQPQPPPLPSPGVGFGFGY